MNLLRIGLFCTLLCSCTTVDRLSPIEQLDNRSGDTLAVVNQPFILARVRSDLAADARDYTTLAAVEVDRAGRYSAYLVLHRWSTFDRRFSPLPDAKQGRAQIITEGREIVLTPLEQLPDSFHAGVRLHAPPTPQFVTWAYLTDLSTLNYLAEAREFTIQFPDETVPLPFFIWRDGRAALREFAARGQGK
jgi:hypothetical protein